MLKGEGNCIFSLNITSPILVLYTPLATHNNIMRYLLNFPFYRWKKLKFGKVKKIVQVQTAGKFQIHNFNSDLTLKSVVFQ